MDGDWAREFEQQEFVRDVMSDLHGASPAGRDERIEWMSARARGMLSTVDVRGAGEMDGTNHELVDEPLDRFSRGPAERRALLCRILVATVGSIALAAEVDLAREGLGIEGPVDGGSGEAPTEG